MAPPLTLAEFVKRWQASTLSEISGYQLHFIDLCQVLDQPTPAAVDQTGILFTFQKGVTKASGQDGFADVWMRGRFAWEYKGKHKDLNAAYQQLLQYKDDLENPPLLVTCDFDRFEIHANFVNTPRRTYTFTLADLLKTTPLPNINLSALEVLRAVFTDPNKLKVERTPVQVTETAAAEFGRLAENLRKTGVEPHQAAHFLMRLLFCLFAEDIGLLPPELFSRLVETTKNRPADFTKRIQILFGQMANGGFFGADDIAYFNGGLFADDSVLDLTQADMEVLARACTLDWSKVEPAIFGTLFERSLDPTKRAQIGAHYTSKEDILLIVEPVLMAPLRREWDAVKKQVQALVPKLNKAKGKDRETIRTSMLALLTAFSTRLSKVKVLDPACGSGNFLYVALKELLDLEKEVSQYALAEANQSLIPQIDPEQLYGIEINPYAHELAQVVVWIGYIQWLRDNGFGIPTHPILKPLSNITHMDAILAFDEQGQPIEPEWPEADVIVGNPPFLGDKKMRAELNDCYVDDLRKLYEDALPGQSDLACYWFEKARKQIEVGVAKRAGLLVTNSIRMGANRRVLGRVKTTGDIFMAWSDRPWILDGAAVRVSMVGFDDGSETDRFLDGKPATRINVDLTATVDVTNARPLAENAGLCYLGIMKDGPFDIDAETAKKMLSAPLNPNGRPNSDVVKRRLGGQDITRRARDGWIIDFGVDTAEREASLYEIPFEYARGNVKPVRDANRHEGLKERWWLHGRSRPALRSAISSLARYIATPEVAKHRVFVWVQSTVIPDHTLHVIARDDDYFFGILHSHVHEVWTLATCSWIGAGNDPRYSSSRTFEAFPLPWPPRKEPENDLRVKAIAQAAKELVEMRDAWLNPKDASVAELKERTLTNLYNLNPTWLKNLHQKLDAAVLAAYGWRHDLTDEQILENLSALNLERAKLQVGITRKLDDTDTFGDGSEA